MSTVESSYEAQKVRRKGVSLPPAVIRSSNQLILELEDNGVDVAFAGLCELGLRMLGAMDRNALVKAIREYDIRKRRS